MDPKILLTISSTLLPQFTKSQTHPFVSNPTPAKSLQFNHNPRRAFKISCIKKKEPTTDETLPAELSLHIKNLNNGALQREEALKKSRELLFIEVNNFTRLQPEDLRKKWRRMDEEEIWVLANGFVSEWSAHFHQLSARSVKEMVEEYLAEEGEFLDSGSISASRNLFPDFGKLLGFSRNGEE
ncbi:uncharacterized protein LOC142554743 [Primulina tabacum]|uniref:uncharacterized protein LOC142554743 n=1 Tax=Primulina tabacum TaxID=48773 RepID=UPI003F59F41E